MKDLFTGLSILSMIVVALSMGFGVNLKKWHGWAQVLSGFLLGLLTGQNLVERMVFGIFFALLIMWLGPIAWKRLH